MLNRFLQKISKELIHGMITEVKKAIPDILEKLDKIAKGTKNPYDDMIVNLIRDFCEEIGLIEKTV